MNLKQDIKAFKKLSMVRRYKQLKLEGEYIASRHYSSHFIHLFLYRGFYVEIWVIVGIEGIHWIEIQNNAEILAEYTEKVDISTLFDAEQ